MINDALLFNWFFPASANASMFVKLRNDISSVSHEWKVIIWINTEMLAEPTNVIVSTKLKFDGNVSQVCHLI